MMKHIREKKRLKLDGVLNVDVVIVLIIRNEIANKIVISNGGKDMNEVIALFEKTFGVNINGCPWGSCTEDFLLEKAIETIEGSDLGISDKENLIDIFKANMYHGLGRFSNGKHAGKWYINLIKEYFNNWR